AAAQQAAENVTKSAATAGRAGVGLVAGRDPRLRLRRRLLGVAAEMLEALVGNQRQDRHGDRRHAALGIGIGLAARAVLHAIENVEQTHRSLLLMPSPDQMIAPALRPENDEARSAAAAIAARTAKA